eukprot:2584666-Amphidinium_carterae.1
MATVLQDLKDAWVASRSDGRLAMGLTDAGMSRCEVELKHEVDSLVVSAIAVHASTATKVCDDDLLACSRGLLEKAHATSTSQQSTNAKLLERLLDVAHIVQVRACCNAMWQASIVQVSKTMLAGPTKLLHYAETLLLRLSEMCRHLLSRRSPLSFDGATWTAYQRPLVQAKQLLKTGMQKELAEKLLQETLEHLISVNLLSAPLEQHLCDAAVLGVLAFQQAMLRGNASCIRKAASHLAWLCLTVLQTLESHSSEPIPTEDDGALAE